MSEAFISTVVFYLVIFQVKHFLADFPLQSRYMLGKFKEDWNFVPHLAAHASVHAFFTFLIVWLSGKNPMHMLVLAVQLAAFDFVAHFVMDRMKASPHKLGRFKDLGAKGYADAMKRLTSWQGYVPSDHEAKLELNNNKYFWWSLGLDQMVHHLTHYAIIYFILVNR